MKRNSFITFLIAFVVLLASCTPTETVEPAVMPTEIPEQETVEVPTQEPTDEPEAASSPIPEEIAEVLENPVELFHEGVEQMTENMGGQFGFIDVKEPGDGYFQFASGAEGAYMPLNTRFKDFGGDGRRQQAFWMRFMLDPVGNLSFTFMGMGEVVISFEGDGVYCIYVQEVTKEKISDFQFEPDKWYNILFATDNDMKLQVVVWEDGNYENQASYERDLFIGMDDLYESNWEVTVGFDSNTTLKVTDYSVYSFDNLIQNSGGN